MSYAPSPLWETAAPRVLNSCRAVPTRARFNPCHIRLKCARDVTYGIRSKRGGITNQTPPSNLCGSLNATLRVSLAANATPRLCEVGRVVKYGRVPLLVPEPPPWNGTVDPPSRGVSKSAPQTFPSRIDRCGLNASLRSHHFLVLNHQRTKECLK